MKKNREVDYIYDTPTVCGNFKGKKLHADITILVAFLKIKICLGLNLALTH